VRYPEQPPIVEGKLFGAINGMETRYEEKSESFVIRLIFKDENTQPEFLITGFHPETGKIDPLSAFLIYNMKSSSQDENVVKESYSYLDVGLNCYFVPAMISAISLFQNTPGLQDRALELTCIAADRYNSPSAQLHLGLAYMNTPSLKEKSLEYIEKASREPELPIASIILGVLLSPISDMESPRKDAKRSVELFERALKQEKNPLAYHELAMLYYNGIGCQKDIAKAKELNEECKKLQNGNAPPLEERDESYVPKKPDECGCGCEHCEHHHHCDSK
jgi:tetratricopeptide (TPR) repeat protein